MLNAISRYGDAQLEPVARVVRRAAIETARKAGVVPADIAART